MLPPAWLRELGEPAPPRDLAVECRSAVAALAAVTARAVGGAELATRAGLVAVLAAVATDVPKADLGVLALVAISPVLAAAAALTRALADDSVTEENVAAAAAVDEEAADFLASIRTWPVRVRAVELVRELCEKVADEALG